LPITKRTKLAQARRQLKRIEDDEPALRIRMQGLSSEEQAKAWQWFCGVRDKHRAYIQQLEAELESG
jgi:hypothetical protein